MKYKIIIFTLFVLAVSGCDSQKFTSDTASSSDPSLQNVIMVFEARRLHGDGSATAGKRIPPGDFFKLTITYQTSESNVADIMKEVDEKFVDKRYTLSDGKGVWLDRLESVSFSVINPNMLE